MIGIDIRPLASETSVLAIDSVGREHGYGVLRVPDGSTNTVACAAYALPPRPRTDVQRTVEFAVGRYGDLLRKLAD